MRTRNDKERPLEKTVRSLTTRIQELGKRKDNKIGIWTKRIKK